MSVWRPGCCMSPGRGRDRRAPIAFGHERQIGSAGLRARGVGIARSESGSVCGSGDRGGGGGVGAVVVADDGRDRCGPAVARVELGGRGCDGGCCRIAGLASEEAGGVVRRLRGGRTGDQCDVPLHRVALGIDIAKPVLACEAWNAPGRPDRAGSRDSQFPRPEGGRSSGPADQGRGARDRPAGDGVGARGGGAVAAGAATGPAASGDHRGAATHRA